ncbi:E3 ubiquitin/ISG15 ligase TRIM25-like [Bufo bufo]|uniref:E3 ubiquitin/ISG15 ligase TRIM25-like n=1 Tax=Bufo bufo TaxID=8384 RepID=UPI001ABEE5A4|nr:E3 ubiquitin/ISG15 ligase TRIM25-like [Bufo bufo]XP_040292665.1 E3 ubiquitin/ISG15 ligase TRIM25-like [Bufo bufo]XP_040292666.1 E3 ubiquitin/ISG15 ligase TRIM25-like [Bufo bufo]
MAFAALRDELNCSICLSIYTDPVTLRCGHNFCWACIDRVLHTQDGGGVYVCPDCRTEFPERPALHKNLALRNIAQSFHCNQDEGEAVGIFCTYCDSSVPAVKTCLQCEASLCDKHLTKHSKSGDHILMEPTASLENRKCSTHKKMLEYYCTEDSTCICVTCCLAGKHKGHQVEPIDEVSEKKRMKLINILEKLTSKREETEKRVQNLEGQKLKVKEKAAGELKRVASIFKYIRRLLEDLEKSVLCEISRQMDQVVASVSELIQKIESQTEELSREISHIEELCLLTDPLTLLQERKSEKYGLYGAEERGNEDQRQASKSFEYVTDLDKVLTSMTLHTGLADIAAHFKKGLHIVEVSDLLLDIDTVANYVHISTDLKTASYSSNQKYPESLKRFEDCQVLSTRTFSSGRHYWEVEVSKLGHWMIGVCYPSIGRTGDQSYIGSNEKSWCLSRSKSKKQHYSVMHHGKGIHLPGKASSQRLVIYLDYEVGRLSFYELCEPVRHLHTFTAAFTEPLHAAFYIWDEWVTIRS